MALIAKALAHPERVRIVEQFEDGRPRMVHEIVQHSDLAQSTASEHLRILREAGVPFRYQGRAESLVLHASIGPAAVRRSGR